jgi:hypothetical protein
MILETSHKPRAARLACRDPGRPFLRTMIAPGIAILAIYDACVQLGMSWLVKWEVVCVCAEVLIEDFDARVIRKNARNLKQPSFVES